VAVYPARKAVWICKFCAPHKQ